MLWRFIIEENQYIRESVNIFLHCQAENIFKKLHLIMILQDIIKE